MVTRAKPFNSTDDWGTKFEPVTVNVKAGWPAAMFEGERELNFGEGNVMFWPHATIQSDPPISNNRENRAFRFNRLTPPQRSQPRMASEAKGKTKRLLKMTRTGNRDARDSAGPGMEPRAGLLAAR